MAQGTVMTTRLIAADLKGFDSEARDLIMGLADLGCRVRVSRKGHAIIANDVGSTCSVARSMPVANRAAQNTRAAVKKVRDEQLAHITKEQALNKHPLTGQEQEVELTLERALHVPGFAAYLGRWMDENPCPPDAQIMVKFTDDAVLSIERLEAPREDQKEHIVAEKKTTPTPKDVAKYDCPHCGPVPGTKESHAKKAGHRICPEPDCGLVLKTQNGVGPHKVAHEIAKGTRPGWRIDALTAQEKVDAIKGIIDGNGVTLERYTKVIGERDAAVKELVEAQEALAKSSTHGKDYDDLLAEYEKVEKERDAAVKERDELQTWKNTLQGLLGSTPPVQ